MKQEEEKTNLYLPLLNLASFEPFWGRRRG